MQHCSGIASLMRQHSLENPSQPAHQKIWRQSLSLLKLASFFVPLTRIRVTFRYVCPYNRALYFSPQFRIAPRMVNTLMKKKREHLVPMATQVVELITDLERIFYWRSGFSLTAVKNTKYQRCRFAQRSPSHRLWTRRNVHPRFSRHSQHTSE